MIIVEQHQIIVILPLRGISVFSQAGAAGGSTL